MCRLWTTFCPKEPITSHANQESTLCQVSTCSPNGRLWSLRHHSSAVFHCWAIPWLRDNKTTPGRKWCWPHAPPCSNLLCHASTFKYFYLTLSITLIALIWGSSSVAWSWRSLDWNILKGIVSVLWQKVPQISSTYIGCKAMNSCCLIFYVYTYRVPLPTKFPLREQAGRSFSSRWRQTRRGCVLLTTLLPRQPWNRSGKCSALYII